MTTNSITLAGISGGGQYGLGASSNTAVIGPKFLRTTDIVSGEIDWTRVPYCKADQKTIDKYRLSDGDIVISRTGANAGLTAFVTSPPENSIFAGYLVRFKIDRDRAVPKFVSYILVSDTWKHYVATTRTGSAQPQFNAKIMGDFPMLLPSIQVQKASSEVLGALDEKIQINKELSKTLEDIAQTIFKSWFIDFDPVKSKMAGEKPVGMDDATAALFPDSLEDSELGMIPRGWLVEEFGSVSNLLMGQSPPGDTYNEDGAGLPFYQGKTDFGARFPKRRVYCSSGNRLASAGETLISVRAPVGDLNQATEICVIGRGVASALHKSGSQSYSFSLLTSLQPKLAYYNGEGTVFGAINKLDFQSMKVVEPSKSVLTEFDQLTSPINIQIRTLLLQTEVLTALRDSLLPRLISGELQIPEEMLVT
jgi:type I restriction enzyme S subunit